MENNLLDYYLISLIVFDEAHKATGKYAYSLINKFLLKKKVFYRVLALTATPGNNISKTQEIVRNLSISNLEVRSWEDEEVQ